MTNQTKKELALVATVLSAIFGAPKITQHEENQILSAMHDEIITLSAKVTELRSADSSLLIRYTQVANSVDTLVMRARVEDRIRIELQRQQNRQQQARTTSYAEAQTNETDSQSTSRPNEKGTEVLLTDWE